MAVLNYQQSEVECLGKTIITIIFSKYVTSNILQGSLNMCRVCNMSGFRRFQDCHCARVLNSQRYRGFTYFRKYDKVLNMRLDPIIEGF